MKQHRFKPSCGSWINFGMLFIALALYSSAGHASTDLTQPVPSSSSTTSTHTPPAYTNQHAASGKAFKGVDGLIRHLHDRLQITSQQEQLWQGVADVMRQNADTLSGLAKSRAEHATSATAVDDLKSYSDISQAHADAAKKLVAPFQALYDSMSDTQKKAADKEFRDHYQRHHRGI